MLWLTVFPAGLPQCQDFSWQKAKLCGGGVSIIAYIMQSLHKFIVSFFCPVPPRMRAALCKLLVEVLVASNPVSNIQ